jgi:hypothetical protein
MGRICDVYGGEERCIPGLWGNLREGDHLEYPGVDGRVILKWIFEGLDGGRGGIDWIDLAQVETGGRLL